MAAVASSGHWMNSIFRGRIAFSARQYYTKSWCYAVPRFLSSATVAWASAPTRQSQEEWRREKEEELGSFGGAAAMVDGFSEFLLKGSTCWGEAPYCPDYVGPVVVAKTADGCGRGLFATENVRAGTLLLISNPMAITYDDPLRMYLLTELVGTAEKDLHFRRQIYTLAHAHDAQNLLPVPPMELLTSQSSTSTLHIDDDEVPPVDLTRIMDIMMLNSFEGELSKQDLQNPKTRLSGLWLIPSLINHSCHRNASRLIVGGAMVIHAATNIRKGEEITITYVDILAPLQARQKAFRDMRFGFSCICKRCVLEKSVEACLADVSSEFCNFHDQATEEVYMALFLPTPLPLESSFPACTKMSKLFETVRKKVNEIDGRSETEKKWILGGYSSAFLAKWLAHGYATRFADSRSFINHDVLEVVAAMQATIPGLVHILSLIAILWSLAEKADGNDVFAKSLFRLGVDECARVYGNQKLMHLVKLMEKSRDVIPIF